MAGWYLCIVCRSSAAGFDPNRDHIIQAYIETAPWAGTIWVGTRRVNASRNNDFPEVLVEVILHSPGENGIPALTLLVEEMILNSFPACERQFST
jgi:hypothetical protein